MASPTLRRAFLLLALVFGLAVAGAGCHSHGSSGHHSYDVAFEVHNLHGEAIWIEGIDGFGDVVEFATIYPGETATVVLSDYWAGRTLYAHCEYDHDLIDRETAFEGLHWDVY